MKRTLLGRVVALGSLGLLTGWMPLAAQDALHRLDAPIEVDGRLDEPAWAAVTPWPVIALSPTAGAEPSESTEILLAYDDDALYVGARLFGSAPADVAARSLTRDRLSGDNTLAILIDTYGDRENAVEFVTTPAGILVDRAISGDGQQANDSWNTFWSAATTTDGYHWFAEIRIPFSSLRFQETAVGAVIMGVTVSRFIAKTNERVTHPVLSPSYSNPQIRPSLSRRVALRNIKAATPVYLSPYGLTGFQRSHVQDGLTSPFRPVDEQSYEMGLDVKYAPSSNLAVDVTLNTDFAQIEADEQQVNLSRFSLFFPEKRQFFQERSGIFEFATGGGPDRLFHSRRIGLTGTGEPLRIYGGLRAVGRTGAWDFGVMDMQVEAPGGTGSENLGLLRLRRSVLTPGSAVGGLLTSRVGADGGADITLGVDALVRPVGNDYVTLQWAQVFNESTGTGGVDGAMARILWERRSDQGWVYSAGAKWTGESHDPALGFVTRAGYTFLNANLRYGFFPGHRTIFRSVQPSAVATTFIRNEPPDGGPAMETRTLNGYLNFELKNGAFGFLFVGDNLEDLPAALPIAGGAAVIPAGSHEWRRLGLSVFAPPANAIRANAGVYVGSFYDGTQWTASLAPSWNVSRHVELGAEYAWNRIRFPDRDQYVDADLARLRATVALDARLSVASFLQYNRVAGTVAGNARLRYRFGEGRDLWLVYNDVLNSDLDRVPGVELPRSARRALVLKYTHTMIP